MSETIKHIRQVGYPVLTLTEDGGTSQGRFLSLASTLQDASGGAGSDAMTADEPDLSGSNSSTKWTIPTRVVWEGAEDGKEELVVMLAESGDGEGDRQLKAKLQDLAAAGKWFKVSRLLNLCTALSAALESAEDRRLVRGRAEGV